MGKIPVGLELYSVREQLAADPLGTLKAVAEMGYTGVEFAGAPAHTAEEYRAMLDETGLVCCGWHTPFNLVQADTLADTIAFNQTVGNRYVIIPGIPGHLVETREQWQRMAGVFNDLAAALAPHDMQTGYHNHHIEFKELDGERPWDTFFGGTCNDVIMQLDTGNAMLGGGDPIAILKEYTGRSQTIHLKPFDTVKGQADPHAGFRTMIGEDSTPWQELFGLCESTADTQWYIVEYECDLYPPLDAVSRCLDALRALGVTD